MVATVCVMASHAGIRSWSSHTGLDEAAFVIGVSSSNVATGSAHHPTSWDVANCLSSTGHSVIPCTEEAENQIAILETKPVMPKSDPGSA